jgi:hypothetical protein
VDRQGAILPQLPPVMQHGVGRARTGAGIFLALLLICLLCSSWYRRVVWSDLVYCRVVWCVLYVVWCCVVWWRGLLWLGVWCACGVCVVLRGTSRGCVVRGEFGAGVGLVCEVGLDSGSELTREEATTRGER